MAKASVVKTLALRDAESLQSAYDAYAKTLINRRLVVPAKAVADVVGRRSSEGKMKTALG